MTLKMKSYKTSLGKCGIMVDTIFTQIQNLFKEVMIITRHLGVPKVKINES